MVNINVLRALANGNPIPVPFVHQLVSDVLRLQDSLKEKDSIINSLKEELQLVQQQRNAGNRKIEELQDELMKMKESDNAK